MKLKKKKILRIISILLALVFILLILPSCSIKIGTTSKEKDEAERIKSIEEMINSAKLQYPTKNDEFFYNIYDNHIMITKYIGAGGEVVVPQKLNDLPVYVIGAEAFKNSTVTKVEIAEGVYEIRENCFQDCKALEVVQLPNSLIKIGKSAFSKCSNLTEIVFPKYISSIPSSVCYECTSLKTVKILTDKANSSISDTAFIRCSSLERVYMSDAVSSISSNAFSEVPNTVIFYGPAGSSAAEYCAKNIYEYVVVKTEQEVPDEGESEVDSSADEITEESPSGSVWPVIIVGLLFFGIIGGLIAFLVIRRRRY